MPMHLLATLALAFSLIVTSPHALSTNATKSAGISKADAVSIATRYFANEIAIEGGVGEPSEQGDYSVFPLKFGARAVVARDPVLVNRFTGEASWAGLEAQNAALGRSKKATTK